MCARLGPRGALARLFARRARARVGRGRPLRLSRETRFCAHRCVSCYRLERASSRPSPLDMRCGMEAPPCFRGRGRRWGTGAGSHIFARGVFSIAFFASVRWRVVSLCFFQSRFFVAHIDAKTKAPPGAPWVGSSGGEGFRWAERVSRLLSPAGPLPTCRLGNK